VLGPVIASALLLALVPVSSAAFPAIGREAAQQPSTHDLISAQEYEYANCRFGVAARSSQFEHIDVVSKLNAGWYLDFWADMPEPPDGLTYAPMVRIDQDRGGSTDCGRPWDYSFDPPLTDSGIGRRVDAMPGAQWLIGNEPERVGQDGVCPGDYARAYHEAYEYIKGRDPTAQVFAGGVVEPTPMRLAYLDMVLDAYEDYYGEPMPVDGWSAHLYVLSETSNDDAHIALGTDPDLGVPYSPVCDREESWCHAEHDDLDLLGGLVVGMREWMRDRGYRDRPLLITEFGILKPYHLGPGATCSKTTCSGTGDGCFCDEEGEAFHPQRVADFAIGVLDLLRTATDPDLGHPADGNRLVQQWVWFHLATRNPHDLGHPSNLADPDATGSDGQWRLTTVGQAWRDYVREIPPEPNLFVADVPTATGSASCGTCASIVTLQVLLANNGNVPPGGPVSVTFYADEALTQPIGTAVVAAPAGCVRKVVGAAVVWDGVCAGTSSFWIQITTEGGPAERTLEDNVAEGSIVLDERPCVQTFLPAVWRASSPG
jgi:hypothetical protein